MSSEIKVRLEDFGLSKVEQLAIEQTGVVDNAAIIELLEAYKFTTRNSIIATYNESYKYDEYSADQIVGESDDAYKALEDKYGVVIRNFGREVKRVHVYMPMFRDTNVPSLEIELGRYDTVFFRATTVDYALSRNPQLRLCTDSDLIFKRILIEALRLHATDIHFDVRHVNMKPEYTVSYRQDASLYDMNLFKLTQEDNRNIISRLIENNTSAISLDLLTSNGVVSNASNILGDDNIELRVSANSVLDGYHCVIRIQQKETFNFSIGKLGFHNRVMRDLNTITKKRSGITFITGAIRTGKNTTAFALANEIEKSPVKIISYESPIEVLMPFTQLDYFGNEDALLNAVRLAKKQDINVAFINEIPNKEVAFAVLDLVNSSIHVITTMHMDRIWHLPYKLKEYYGDEYKNVISQINGVFNQKMFGICCDKCRSEILVSSVHDAAKEDFLHAKGFSKIFKSTGCEHCNFTGKVTGKNQPYAEHLIFSDALKSRLLSCNQPFEMESVIKTEVRQREQTLEDYMSVGLHTGLLSLDALDFII